MVDTFPTAFGVKSIRIASKSGADLRVGSNPWRYHRITQT